jgi:hypothetical protein
MAGAELVNKKAIIGNGISSTSTGNLVRMRTLGIPEVRRQESLQGATGSCSKQPKLQGNLGLRGGSSPAPNFEVRLHDPSKAQALPLKFTLTAFFTGSRKGVRAALLSDF